MDEKIVVSENATEEKAELVETAELIVVKQLPVIEEQLKTIKANIESKVANVLALDCNEGTVKAIKVLRADLTKDFKDLEERRKFVKNTIMAPYEAFDVVYKECVTDIFKSADSELKKRIDFVENELKDEKRAKIQTYFREYLESKHIDFVTFEDANINVTMSASEKSLKAAAKAFIDRIADDLKLIDTQEHKEEILVEYKQSLNVSSAITSVTERHKAIDEEIKKQQADQAVANAEQETIKKVNEAKAEIAPLAAPTTKADDGDKVIIMKLPAKVKAKKSDCLILKQLLTNGKYETIK